MHFLIWDKYILKFETNAFCNLKQTRFVIWDKWTNTFGLSLTPTDSSCGSHSLLSLVSSSVVNNPVPTSEKLNSWVCNDCVELHKLCELLLWHRCVRLGEKPKIACQMKCSKAYIVKLPMESSSCCRWRGVTPGCHPGEVIPGIPIDIELTPSLTFSWYPHQH